MFELFQNFLKILKMLFLKKRNCSSVSSITRKILECDMESCYKSIQSPERFIILENKKKLQFFFFNLHKFEKIKNINFLITF